MEKYFSIVKRAFVLVSLATRPGASDGPDFVTKTGTAQNLAIENSKCQWENAFISVSLNSFFDMKNN